MVPQVSHLSLSLPSRTSSVKPVGNKKVVRRFCGRPGHGRATSLDTDLASRMWPLSSGGRRKWAEGLIGCHPPGGGGVLP
eukprot:6491500-Amphidinium_carterae.4